MLLFSHSIMSYALRLHRPEHACLLCPSPSPRACSDSCLLIGDAIQLSHSLSFPSPPTFNLSQHQGLFQWVYSLHQGAKVLEFQLQHQSFQWIFRTDFLEDRLVGSPCSSRDSQGSSPMPWFKSISSLGRRETTKDLPLKNWNRILFEFIVSFWLQPHNKFSPSWRLKQGKRTRYF